MDIPAPCDLGRIPHPHASHQKMCGGPVVLPSPPAQSVPTPGCAGTLHSQREFSAALRIVEVAGGDLNEQFASLSDLVNRSLLVWHGNRRCVNQQSTNYPRASLLLLFQKYFFSRPQVFHEAKVSLEPPLTPQAAKRNPCNTAECFHPLFWESWVVFFQQIYQFLGFSSEEVMDEWIHPSPSSCSE